MKRRQKRWAEQKKQFSQICAWFTTTKEKFIIMKINQDGIASYYKDSF